MSPVGTSPCPCKRFRHPLAGIQTGLPKQSIKMCLEVRAERGMPLTVETRQIRLPVLPAFSVLSVRSVANFTYSSPTSR